MKARQENKTTWFTNPLLNNKINQSIIYGAIEEASIPIHFQNTVLKDVNYQIYHPFFNDQAFADMTLGLIPNFEQLYQYYLEIKPETGRLLPAINFLPALRDFSLTNKEIECLLNNPEPKHIIVQNDQIKIILIRWLSGEQSDIHRHAFGGGLFKVMYGEIEENRYTDDSQQQLLSKSSYFTNHIAYIDDVMGLHSVGNKQDLPALTLHICTSGNY